MKVLIIGGTHFIGLNTANEFAVNGHDVTVFHRHPYSGSELSKKVKHILGDRTDQSKLSQAILLTNPDIIVDMCAFCEKDVKILEAALHRRTRVVVVSSMDVYEAYSVLSHPEMAIQPTPLTEKSMLRTKFFPYRGFWDTPFAQEYEKILVESAAFMSEKIEAVVVRLGMIYGENDPNRRFRSLIQQMMQEKNIILSQKEASWIASKGYVKDIAYGIYLAGLKGMPGQIYNLAEKNPVREVEWLKRIASSMGWNGKIEIQESETSGANWQQDLVIDTQKIRSMLGYEEKYSIEQALRNTIRWEMTMIQGDN